MKHRMVQAAALACAGMVAVVGLAACSSSSSSSTPSPSDAGGSTGAAGFDCAKAQAAMSTYASALAELMTDLAGGDMSKTGPAAEAFSSAADALSTDMPGLPAEAQPFIDVSKQFAAKAKNAAESGSPLKDLVTQAQTDFYTDGFTKAGDSVETYYRSQCPSADSASPSSS